MKFTRPKALLVPLSALFLFSISIFDPADKFGFKKIAFLMLFLAFFIMVYKSGRFKFDINRVLIFIYFILFSILGVFFSLLNFHNVAQDVSFAFSYMLSFLFMSLLIFLGDEGFSKSYNEMFIFSGLLLIFLSISTAVGFLVFPENSYVSSVVSYFNYNIKNAFITTRIFGPFEVKMIYFKAVVLIFPISTFFFERYCKIRDFKSLVPLCLCFVVLYLSGTRTNLILTSFLLIIYFMLLSDYKVRNLIAFVGVFIAPFVVFFLVDLIFSTADVSFNVKSTDFQNYINILFSSNNYLLFGDGFGSEFYSPGKGDYVFITELVYFDLMKSFGILLFFCFFCLLLYPAILFYKSRKYQYLASYFCYLAVAGTNPLLISSTGMLILLFYFNEALKLRNLFHEGHYGYS